jgi:uncharacterized alkaline shock family protein YloU
MTEQEDQQRLDSPLESERGITTISDDVVSKLAGMAAGEVEGVRTGGSASRTAGGLLESITGSDSQKRGISVEVGRVETAVDVTVGIEYGSNILDLVQRVRDRITERVEGLTGLRVTELNVTVSDIIFPDGEEAEVRRGGLESSPGDEDRSQAGQTEEISAGGREREAEDTERVDLGAARAEAMTRAGDRFSEEMLRAEDAPDEDQTAELRLGDEEAEERPPATEDETGSERRRDG